MELYKNKKKHLIVKTSAKELISFVPFGMITPNPESDKSLQVQFESKGVKMIGYRSFICGSCNEVIDGDLYYVASLNELYCGDCIEDIVNDIDNFMCDAEYAVDRFNWFIDECDKYNIEHNGINKIDSVYEYMYSISDVADYTDFNNTDFMEFKRMKDEERQKCDCGDCCNN